MSDDPDARARAFLASLPRDPDVTILTSVLNAALMVKHLPPYAGENTTLPRIVTIACREDFWTNVRLLIEFLYRFPSRHDPNATTVLTKWPKAKDPLATRLNEYWDIASKHVVHFGPERFSGGLEAADVSVSGHRRIADDVLQEWARFIEAVEADADKSHLADLLRTEFGHDARQLADRHLLQSTIPPDLLEQLHPGPHLTDLPVDDDRNDLNRGWGQHS